LPTIIPDRDRGSVRKRAAETQTFGAAMGGFMGILEIV
jgi:hypothetical protein